MNGQVKFPRGQGRPISTKRAKVDQVRWKNDPKNKKYPAGTFSVPMEYLTRFISNPECAGIKFCNGLNDKGKYSPAMCAITEDGEILSAFDSKGVISVEEFETCRTNWEREFPVIEDNTQFFYLGSEAIGQNIADFDVERYEAAFIEYSNGSNNAVLFGYTLEGMKDPGEDEPDTALNRSFICPPICPEL